MYKTCSTKSKLPRIAPLESSHKQFQTQTWGKCNHLQPDLLLLHQRMEQPRTQSQPGSTRHSNCKKMHGCMTHSFDSWESQRIMPSIKECCPVVVNIIRESGVCLQASRRWQAGAWMHMEWVVIGCCCSVCEGALTGYLMLCCNRPEAANVHTTRRTHSKHRQKLEWALLRWDCQWQMWIWNSWLKNWFWISRAAVAEHWSLLLQHHLLLLLAASAAAESHWGHGHNWQRRSS